MTGPRSHSLCVVCLGFAPGYQASEQRSELLDAPACSHGCRGGHTGRPLGKARRWRAEAWGEGLCPPSALAGARIGWGSPGQLHTLKKGM